MGRIDVRKGIFSTLLTTLWQSMQSCTEESFNQNLPTRSPTVGEGVTPPHPR